MTQQLHLSDVEKEKEIEIDKDKEIENKYICPEVNSGQPQPKVEIEPVAENRTKVEIEPSCSKAELKVETEPAQADVFIKLPLINGDDYLVTKECVKELKELYPAVDVEQALRNMRGWLDSNPRNKKTPRESNDLLQVGYPESRIRHLACRISQNLFLKTALIIFTREIMILQSMRDNC